MSASVISVKYDATFLRLPDEFRVIVPSSGELKDMKVLLLLHGMHGNCDDWINFTNIIRLAETHHVAVIMPSARNSFYTDMVYGEPYYREITEEVMGLARRMFGFSTKRENNMIAGLSMGGFGAFKIAFNNPDRYYAAGSFSGALDILDLEGLKTEDEGVNKANEKLFRNILGEKTSFKGTENDLAALVKMNMTKNGYSIKDMRLYQYCGNTDFLYGYNMGFRKILEENGMHFTFHTDGGSHDWERWNEQIALFLNEFAQ